MFEFSLRVRLAAVNRILPSGPAAGMDIVVTLEDGTTVQGRTDESGVADFAIPEGTQNQRCDIVVHKPDHGFTAYVDQDLTDLNLDIWMFGPPDADVTVHGTASGIQDPEHALLVGATSTWNFQQTASEIWALEVPPGAPFTLVGLEFSAIDDASQSERGIAQDFFSWKLIELPALEEDREVDLNFENSARAVQFAGSFSVPLDNGILSQLGLGYVQVTTGGSKPDEAFAFCGACTRIDISDDGSRFEYVGEFVPTSHPAATTYSIRAGQVSSFVAVEGYPSDGHQEFVPLGPPVIVSPRSDQLPWGTTIRWIPDEASEELFAAIAMVSDDGQFGRIFAPPGSSELRWPTLPDAIDPSIYFGSAPVLAFIEVSDWTAIAGPPKLVERSVNVQSFTVTAP